MAINKIEAAFVEQLRREVAEALAPIAKRYGLAGLGFPARVTYNATEIRGTVVMKLVNQNSLVVVDKQISDSKRLGFDVNIIGKRFHLNGKHFEVKDIDLRKPKKTLIITEISTNKEFICGHRGIVFTDGTKQNISANTLTLRNF